MISPKKTRKTYSAEALKLASKFGVTQVSRELSIYGSKLYACRSLAREKAPTSERENILNTKNAKSRRQVSAIHG